ncbi:MAG: UDP-N-acetylmuramate dehydrogenase [Pseudomonadota bacterium]
MADERALSDIERAAGGTGVREAPLGRLTSFGSGGAAAMLLELDDPEAVCRALAAVSAAAMPLLVIGKGSNLLVADEGFDGVALMLEGPLKDCTVEGELLLCGAGAGLPRASRLAMDAGLSGLEPLAQIPGSIGGAVAMNAGAFGAEIGSLVEWVEVCGGAGARRVERSGLDFGYRRSGLAAGEVVTRVALRLSPADPEEIRLTTAGFRERRESAQPVGRRSFGSVFRNPEGASAGRLLDEAGCKGMRRGGASVSDFHANFIVNEGNATTADVVELMKACQRRVFEASGVTLKPEVRFVGNIGLGELS